MVDLPVASPSGRQLPSGAVTAASLTGVYGWVVAPEGFGAVQVDLHDGDQLLASTLATSPDGDVPEDGRLAFAFAFHESLFPMARHHVRVVLSATGADLEGSPLVLERDSGPLDARGLRAFERMMSAQIATARSAPELDSTLEMLVQHLNEVLVARNLMAARVGQGPPPVVGGDVTGEFEQLVLRIQSAYPHLDLPTVDAPLVSIIIPVYNQFGYTYQCLNSLLGNPPDVPYEVIVVDDRSSDETLLARLVVGDSVRIIRNAQNGGFIKSCNAGARAARGRFLFFLNNDTQVKPGAVDSLVDTFRFVENCGIAGSRLVFPDGKLQECGGIIWRMGDGWNWGRDNDPAHPRFMYMRDSDYVSGAALMIRRDVFEELGGFDELYLPAYYEDTDLCFKVRQKGLRVVVQPTSEIVHHEGVSNGTSVTGTGLKKYQVVNQRKFLERWRPVLARHRFNGQMPELEVERDVTRRALFIDDSVPTPDQDAGSNAAYQHMRSLQRLGYKVTFVPGDNMAKIDPYTRGLQALGIECLYHPFYTSVEDILKRVTPKYDFVYLHRYSNASKYAGLVRQHCPAARVVYNVADLHYLRMERQASVENAPKLAADAQRMKRSELAAMSLVDAVIVHSDHEAQVLAGVLEEASVFVVPWTVHAQPMDTPPAARSGVGFIGGYGHRPNVDAAEWLATRIMPLVNRVDPSIVCYLAGSKMPDRVSALASPSVRPIGWVPTARDFYARLRLSIAPLRYGAGVKGKVLDSFAAGIPCVMTPIAAEGIPLTPALSRLVAQTQEDIARLVVTLHRDPAMLDALAMEGIRLIQDHYSPQAIDGIMRGVVSGDTE